MLTSSPSAAPFGAVEASASAARLAAVLYIAAEPGAMSAFGVSGLAELFSALLDPLSLCLSLLWLADFLSESGAALFLDLSAERLRECLFLSFAL